jgi:hypothetical protein
MAYEFKCVNSNLNSQQAYTKCWILKAYLNTPMNTIMSIAPKVRVGQPVQQSAPGDAVITAFRFHFCLFTAPLSMVVTHKNNNNGI